jgi:hypothetical protein
MRNVFLDGLTDRNFIVKCEIIIFLGLIDGCLPVQLRISTIVGFAGWKSVKHHGKEI